MQETPVGAMRLLGASSEEGISRSRISEGGKWGTLTHEGESQRRGAPPTLLYVW